MPPNDIMGECHDEDCGKEVPVHALTQIRVGGEIKFLCGNCRTKHCDHPEDMRGETPQGRPMCKLCQKVLKAEENTDQETQTTLEVF